MAANSEIIEIGTAGSVVVTLREIFDFGSSRHVLQAYQYSKCPRNIAISPVHSNSSHIGHPMSIYLE